MSELEGDPSASIRAATPTTPPESGYGAPTLAAGAPASALAHPQRVGRYRIDSVLGEGGMGVVYRAEQTHPVKRTVALKLIKLGLDTRQVVSRFDGERQALAMIDHPNVARVFDAGADDLGRPYFVMEYVAGVPLTQYCDAKRLSNARRLALFVQSCNAIQHAHQKGIIHRDLKPGNILVHEVDGEPAIKVIDFGLAKAMSAPLSERAMTTERGQLLGTPEYMAPEQASGHGVVDTRADVYALGVILYELLTGQLPFDAASLRSGTVADLERTIREVEPPRPSARLTRDVSLLTLAAHARGTDAQALVRTLRSDLDWVVMRAIEKDPERRYPSVSELAADVQRYLRHEPVLAGPPTVAYRVRKFVRRNRVGVGVTLLVLASLVIGLVTTTRQMIRARRAEAEANARFNDVRELANTFMFDFHRLVANLPGSTPAVKKLVETSLDYLRRLEPRAKDDPTLLADIAKAYERVGDIQGNPNMANLGDTSGALTSHRKSLELRDRLLVLRPEDIQLRRDRAVSADVLGQIHRLRGESDEAMRHFRAALEQRTDLVRRAPDNTRLRLDLATSRINVGDVHRDRGAFDESLASFDAAVGDLRALIEAAPDNPELQYRLAGALNRGGDVLEKQGKPDAALARYQEALDVMRRLVKPDSLNMAELRSLALGYNKVARMLAQKGEHARALEMMRQAQDLDRRRAQADPDDAQAQRDYASSTYALGGATARTDPKAALDLYRECLRIAQGLAQRDPNSLSTQSDLASTFDAVGEALAATGDQAAALAHYRRGLTLWRKLHAEHPDDMEHTVYLAEALLRTGSFLATKGQDAKPLFDEADAVMDKVAARGPLPPELQAVREQLDARLSPATTAPSTAPLR